MSSTAYWVQAKVAEVFAINDHVTKLKGSEWSGRVCGFYSTALTPDGICVESEHHKGSVQIYPASALKLVSGHFARCANTPALRFAAVC